MKPTFRELSIDAIDVPPEAQREHPSPTEDEILEKSIRASGIQQPVIVVPDGDRFRLVKGSRRLACAPRVGLPRVPAMIVPVPPDEQIADFARRLKFILDEHRQDLLPSQRAELVVKLKELMHITNKAIAEMLGFDQDSITNWLAIRRYLPEIASAIDAGRLTMKLARVFDGMTPVGQEKVWKKHAKELCTGKDDVRKRLRMKYTPDKYAEFYRKPEVIARRLDRKVRGRRGGRGKQLYDAAGIEKKRLQTSVAAMQAELAELREEAASIKRDIADATPIIHTIITSGKLWNLVPDEVKPEFEQFALEYV